MPQADEGELVHSRIGAGARSAEVLFYNQSSAALTITSTNRVDGTNWIAGEVPAVGYVLQPATSAMWGVCSQFNPSRPVEATVTLGGYGSPDIKITWSNDQNGHGNCTVTDNSKLAANPNPPQEQPTEDDNYQWWIVNLTNKPMTRR